MSNVWIYDLETLSNCFTASFINKDSDDIKTFVVWKNRNNLKEMLDFLDTSKGLIGFNNISFDYPVLHLVLLARKKLLKMNGDEVAKFIYQKAQDTIQKMNEGGFTQIKNPIIPQLDVYKIHHFDNKAKMTSLKKIEVALGFENVQDMPIHHKDEIKTDEEVTIILDYNINDIKATKVFYEKTLDKIELRKGLIKRYGLPCINYSDSKIGEELVLKLYAEAVGKTVYDIKKGRTNRKIFKFSECIPNYIKFQTEEFNNLLEYLKGIEVQELKQSFDYQFIYNNSEFYLGTGGIHQSIKEGIYESDEKYILVDADVGSMYPSLAVVNNIYPEHLGESFCKVYAEVLNERMIAKKEKDMVMADGFKLALNSVYGKSNSEYSPFFDGLYTLKTTLAGQLSLCMLVEMLSLGIKDLTIIQTNTDGITVKIRKEDRRIYLDICKEWEKLTKLNLEYIGYDKMIIRDVNNYIAIANKKAFNKVKRKGVFVLHEEMRKNNEWHKAFNQGIVPIALSNYFLNDIPVEETIKNHENIYDFCKSFSVKGKFTSELYELDQNLNEINVQKTYKTNRYYLSNHGLKFRKRGEPLAPKFDKRLVYKNKQDEERFVKIKEDVNLVITNSINNGEINKSTEGIIKIILPIEDYRLFSNYFKYLNYIFNVSRVDYSKGEEYTIESRKDWRLMDIEAGDSLVTIFNKYQKLPIEDYNINYEFYIEECNKVIDTITGEKERLINEKKLEKEIEIRKRQEENYILFCINKIPTSKQFEEYGKDWLVNKYGIPKEIKPSKLKIKEIIIDE